MDPPQKWLHYYIGEPSGLFMGSICFYPLGGLGRHARNPSYVGGFQFPVNWLDLLGPPKYFLIFGYHTPNNNQK